MVMWKYGEAVQDDSLIVAIVFKLFKTNDIVENGGGIQYATLLGEACLMTYIFMMRKKYLKNENKL